MLQEFASSAPHYEFILSTPSWAEPLVNPLPDNVEVVQLRSVPHGRAKRIIYQQTALPAALARQRLDVFFATATVAPLLCPVPTVLAVQFTQFYEWPRAYGRVRTSYLKVFLPASLRKAKRAIIFTESAKEDLARWTGVPRAKVSVVPHGLSPEFWRTVEQLSNKPELSVVTELTGGRPYVLYVSATYGYKNHGRLIQAFGILQRRLDLPHVLVLVGSPVTVSFAELRSVAERSGVAEKVIFAGRLERSEEVVATYMGADMTVIPTLYETFGYPSLEAMACGSPVVTSNTGSMAEVSGQAAVIVNPLDVESIADGMEKVLTDPEFRGRLITRGREHARAYTLKRSAAQTLQILEEVARMQNAHSDA